MTKPTNQTNSPNATSSSAAQPPEEGGGQAGAQLGVQVAAVTNAPEQPQTSGGSRATDSPQGAAASTADDSAAGTDANATRGWTEKASDFFKAMPAEKVSRKLDEGWKENGIFRRLENKLFALNECTNPSGNTGIRESFDELLAPCKKLLSKINRNSMWWKRNEQLAERVCQASALVSYAGDFMDPAGTVRNYAGAADTFCFRMVYQYIRHRGLSWDLDRMQPKIKDFLNQTGCILASPENRLAENTWSDATSLAA
ncbi:MAG: hypothetical protein ACRC1U_05380, partial [Vibrionaceae bacterium]